MLTIFMAIVFLSLTSQNILAQKIQEWGFIPNQWARHNGMTLGSSFFLHAGWFHLLSNLYFLVIFGDNVEDHLGKLRFLLLLAGAHLAGSFLHAAFDPRGEVPCVGASAGISGVIAYYALLFPRARIGFFFWLLLRWLRVRAVWAFVAFLAVQLLGTWRQIGGASNVSYLAHLGGLAVGMVAAMLVRITAAPAGR
jgi:membrane associated rhomboid family serine protease